MLEAYIDETHYTVWKLLCNIFTKLDIMLDGTEFHRKFTSFAKFIMSNVEDKTKWEAKEGEGHLMHLRRPIILSTLVQLGHDPTNLRAQKLFDLATRGEAEIPEELRTLVYRSVLGTVEEEGIRQFLKVTNKNSIPKYFPHAHEAYLCTLNSDVQGGGFHGGEGAGGGFIWRDQR